MVQRIWETTPVVTAAFTSALRQDWSSEMKNSHAGSVSREDRKEQIDASLKTTNEKIALANKRGFDSMDDAAKFLNDISGVVYGSDGKPIDVEVSERIFYGNDRYLIGNVVTNYQSGYVDVADSRMAYFKNVVAEWHTHGSDPIYYTFSENDLFDVKSKLQYLSAPTFSAKFKGVSLLKNNGSSTCLLAGDAWYYGECK
ncbi:hypothetical protein [Gallaecimonas sp. GXIMD1310]|uniref:hypothetical protein n=1 Tax=Gallaecimonas sp. GXIMD1310 TaxID=3131926 RepID=UPI003251DFF3